MNIYSVLFIIPVFFNYAVGFFPLFSRQKTSSTAKSEGCWFGNNLHEVGLSWHPNLGPPFGVMHCIRCYCVQDNERHKKSSPKVKCHDIRKNCPKLSCKFPKIEKGECCHSCPETIIIDKEKSKQEADIDKTYNDESVNQQKNNNGDAKYFISLLTSNDKKESTGLSRVNFNLIGPNLYFNLQNSKTSSQLRSIELIIDSDNEVVHFYNASNGNDSANNVLCGVWKNLSKKIIQMLENGKISVRAIFENEIQVGKISSHRALSAETFNALLTANLPGFEKYKASAVVLISFGRNFKNINFVLLYNYRKLYGDAQEISKNVYFKLDLLNEDNEVLRFTEALVHKAEGDYANVWPASSEVLKWFGRGILKIRLTLKLSGVHDSALTISGYIKPRATCGALQTILSGSSCKKAVLSGGGGLAQFVINQDNTVDYHVQVDSGSKTPITSVMLNGLYRKKRSKVIADLSPQLNSGVAEGKLEGLGGKEIHILLHHNAYVTASTSLSTECYLSGDVEYKQEKFTANGQRFLLLGKNSKINTSGSGYLVADVTEDCNIHYQIGISGFKDEQVTALLEPATNDIATIKLENFDDNKAQGVLTDLNDEIYLQLNSGKITIKIATKKNPGGEISSEIHLQNNCAKKSKVIPNVFKSDETTMFNAASDQKSTQSEQLFSFPKQFINSDSKGCHFEGTWYNEGARWSPEYDLTCTECQCKYGSVICEPVVCPVLNCERPVIVEDSCCPICQSTFPGEKETDDDFPLFLAAPVLIPPSLTKKTQEIKHVNEKEGCYDENDKTIYHPRGSTWNPVVKPFGIVRCVTCTCNYDDETICEKIQCPPTNCKFPIKRDPSECCKVCPVNQPQMEKLTYENTRRLEKPTSMNLQRFMLQDGADNMCHFGRKVYALGETWKPDVIHRGKLSCVNCSCELDRKNGIRYKCRKTCPKIPKDCADVVKTYKDCCSKCISRKTQ